MGQGMKQTLIKSDYKWLPKYNFSFLEKVNVFLKLFGENRIFNALYKSIDKF